MEKKILYSLEIEGNDALLQEMAKIRKENAELTKGNKEYQKALRENKKLTTEQAREYEKNAVTIKDNNKQLNELTKSLKSSGGAAKGIRDELTILRKRMQESAEAGDTSSKAFVDMRNRAAELEDNINRVNAEIKVFADDAMVINTVVDATQGLAAGFQLAQSAQALMGVESEKLMEVLVKLQAAQGLVNGLQTVSNLLQKESRLVILGKVAAVKIATAAQWLWNKAMTANPIGLIIVAVAALVAGIVVLVKNFNRITEAVKENRKWFLALLGPIGLAIAAFKHFSKESREARKATRELKEEQDRLIESNERIIKQSEKRSDFLGHQINVMRALGASTDEIRKKEEERILVEMRGAQAAYDNVQARIAAGKLSKKQTKEAIEEAEELLGVYTDIQRQYEIFQAEQTKINREAEEARRKEAEETAIREREIRNSRIEEERKARETYIKNETLASAQLLVLREKSLENELNLLKVQRDQKLANDNLTNSERLIIEEEFQQKSVELANQYLDLEVSGIKEKLQGNYNERLGILNEHYQQKLISHEAYLAALALINEEEELRLAELEEQRKEQELLKYEAERERYLAILEQRRLDEMSDHEQRLIQLDDWLANKIISEEEYTAERIRLNEELEESDRKLTQARIEASFREAQVLLGNLDSLADGSVGFAKFAKVLAIGQSIASIAQGVAKTASIGFPQNIPMLIGYAAQTVGILNTIKSIKEPTKPKIDKPSRPRLAKGGIIGGKPHFLGGTVFRGSDGSEFEAEKGEYLAIVNKYDAQRAALLDSVNQRHGDGFTTNSKTYFDRGGIYEPRQDFNENNMEDIIRQVVSEVSHIPVVVSEKDISDTQNTVRRLKISGDL